MLVAQQVDFVRKALSSLNARRVVGADRCDVRRFAWGFNHWYCPAVRRGFDGPMAAVFDIGLLLFEPGSRLRPGDDDYTKFLSKVSESPLSDKSAARVLGDAPREARPQVEWLLMEPVLRAMGGYWGKRREDIPEILPELKADHQKNTLVLSGSEETIRIDPADMSEDREKNAPDIRITKITDPLALTSVFRVFLAYIAGCMPDAVSRLDYEVVEACLHGPNLKTQENEPPPLRRTHISTNTRSILPGPIAGVTRIATKKPEDPLSDVLPSELALLRMNPEAGLANILYGKPLIVEHETEKDKVPKHRTLVCFVADAGPDENVAGRLSRGRPPAYVPPQLRVCKKAIVRSSEGPSRGARTRKASFGIGNRRCGFCGAPVSG